MSITVTTQSIGPSFPVPPPPCFLCKCPSYETAYIPLSQRFELMLPPTGYVPICTEHIFTDAIREQAYELPGSLPSLSSNRMPLIPDEEPKQQQHNNMKAQNNWDQVKVSSFYILMSWLTKTPNSTLLHTHILSFSLSLSPKSCDTIETTGALEGLCEKGSCQQITLRLIKYMPLLTMTYSRAIINSCLQLKKTQSF